MLIEADPDEARAEQAAVQRAVARGPARRSPEAAALPLDHPATYAFHFTRDAAAREPVGTLADRARAGAVRAAALGCPAWRLDPAPPEPHLTRSLNRALAQVPADRGRPDVTLARWDDRERALLCEVGCLLARVVPSAHAELVTVLRQVALVAGQGLSGYTDFGVHGAVFVNRLRFTDTTDGLPARVRLAEALVHEGTHVRCNAAGWSGPYLADPKDRSVVVDTPLRADPRPLNGLFQQFVVLARCVPLYERLLGPGGELIGAERGPVERRLDILRRQWGEAAAALRRSAALLSARGTAELEHAERLLSVTTSAGRALSVGAPSVTASSATTGSHC